MKKYIIWSNIDLDPKDWKDDFEEYISDNDLDLDPDSEDDLWDYIYETNNWYLDDERANLNLTLDGRILVIGSLGLWNGRVPGYKILGNNLSDFLEFTEEYAEFYGDGYNIRGTEIHHDGFNHYLYRMIREDRNIDNFLDKIYRGEKITNAQINYYTRSLYPFVKQIYGWK